MQVSHHFFIQLNLPFSLTNKAIHNSLCSLTGHAPSSYRASAPSSLSWMLTPYPRFFSLIGSAVSFTVQPQSQTSQRPYQSEVIIHCSLTHHPTVILCTALIYTRYFLIISLIHNSFIIFPKHHSNSLRVGHLPLCTAHYRCSRISRF